jgi:undecaprenyl diphosphate synthase
MRISNFLIWQSAYSELYFTAVLWPDFNKDEVEKALDSYSKRERRFGRRVGGDRRSRGQDGG